MDTLQLEISNLNLTFGSSFSLSGIAGFSYYFLAANLTAQVMQWPGPTTVCSTEAARVLQSRGGMHVQAELTAQPGPAPVQVPSPEPFLQPAGTAPAAAPTPLAASGAGAQSIMSPAFAPLAGQSLSAIRMLSCTCLLVLRSDRGWGFVAMMQTCCDLQAHNAIGFHAVVKQSDPYWSPAAQRVSLGVAEPLGCTYGSDPSCSSCENGWTGAYCDVCLSDNVCNAELGTDNAVCNNSAIYTR